MSESDDGDATADGPDAGRNQQLVRIGLLIVVLVVAVVAADVVLGLGFLTGGNDGGNAGTPTSTPVPTLAPPSSDTETATPGIESGETPGPEESTAAENDGATPTTAAGVTVRGNTRQFRFNVLSVDECGQTCRDVDVELVNQGSAVTSVSATSRLYAGERDPDNKVDEVTTDVGDMAEGERVQRTVRIDPGYGGGLKLCNADRATLVTTVRSDEQQQEFTSHPDIGC
jgi:hypothetical protein